MTTLLYETLVSSRIREITVSVRVDLDGRVILDVPGMPYPYFVRVGQALVLRCSSTDDVEHVLKLSVERTP